MSWENQPSEVDTSYKFRQKCKRRAYLYVIYALMFLIFAGTYAYDLGGYFMHEHIFKLCWVMDSHPYPDCKP